MSARLNAIASLLGGHYWTVQPFVPLPLAARRARVWHSTSAPTWARAAPDVPAPAQAWSGYAEDAQLGRVRLTGQLHAPGAARSLLLSVHGLGGSSESPYLAASVRAAARSGWACLRLNMRGADGSGEDFYHAALTADLHAALASPELARFSDIYLLGYSLGGHLALCFAAEAHDARVRAVAAVCSPLDLSRSAAAIDPMVPANTVRPALAHAAPNLDTRWLHKGGHVGFPNDVDLGESGPRGLEMQVLSWLSKRA